MKTTANKKPVKSENKRNEKGQFLPGNNANPKGRPPKDVCITDLLKVKLEEIDPKTGLTNGQLLTNVLYQLALNGNMDAIKEVVKRRDGNPIQKVEQQVDQVITVEYVDELALMEQ